MLITLNESHVHGTSASHHGCRIFAGVTTKDSTVSYVNCIFGRLKHLEGEEITDTTLFTSGIYIPFRPYLGTVLELYYIQFLHY